jgi:hypothetical protein
LKNAVLLSEELQVNGPTLKCDIESPNQSGPLSDKETQMTKHSEQRFYCEGRKVMDREKSSHGPLFCTARSNHAAEMIQRALNNRIALGPSKTPKMTPKDYAQLRRLQAMAKKSAIRQESTTDAAK